MARVISEKILVNLEALKDAGHIDQQALDELRTKNIEQDTEVLELKTRVDTLETAKADLAADLQSIAAVFSDPAVAQPETNTAIAGILTESDAVPGAVEPAFPTE